MFFLLIQHKSKTMITVLGFDRICLVGFLFVLWSTVACPMGVSFVYGTISLTKLCVMRWRFAFWAPSFWFWFCFVKMCWRRPWRIMTEFHHTVIFRSVEVFIVLVISQCDLELGKREFFFVVNYDRERFKLFRQTFAMRSPSLIGSSASRRAVAMVSARTI